jgi:hypothetical protein
MNALRKYSMLIMVAVIIVAVIGYSLGKKYAYADNATGAKQLSTHSE